MYDTKAYSAASATSPLASTKIKRRDPTEHDVQIEILFCGICHSDLHAVRNEWSSIMPTTYPIVPGHEIVGRVTRVGSAVTNYKPGDLAAVGCLVDSDGTCPQCKAGLEQFCPNLTLTFNSPDKHLGGATYGGYSDSIVVDEHFVLRVPANLNLEGRRTPPGTGHSALHIGRLRCTPLSRQFLDKFKVEKLSLTGN
jgi:alcohol dehydrogenase (NADP+)